jgi:hypothetical protein
VLYQVAVRGTNVDSASDFTFTNNLIVGAGSACFAVANSPTTSDKMQVRDNFCQGSQWLGFILPLISCDQLDYNPFAYNTAGSCAIGFQLSSSEAQCQAFSYLSAYACSTGQTANPS